MLDLEMAWRRVKSDFSKRIFLRHPYALQLIEFDLPGWLNSCREKIVQGYHPHPMFVCDVPKPGGLIRPGSHLAHDDRLVYAALVGACFPAIHERLLWSQGVVDFSYRLAADAQNTQWLRDRFTGWKAFQDGTLAKFNQGYAWCVLTDISAFYENIDVSLLISDLRETRAPSLAIEQISVCLNRWAQAPGRGIPQGQSPSDILAKLYLNNVDQALRNAGFAHLRYVDDVRIFCRTEEDCKRMLIFFSAELRRRGLNLQSAKTHIYRAEEARDKVEEITAELKLVRLDFIADIVRETGHGDPYMSVHEADEILDENPEEAPLEILRRAYEVNIMDHRHRFNHTLFHFLLGRLGKQRNSFAAEHCVTLLEPRPEETEPILDYLGNIGPGAEIEERLLGVLRSPQMIYHYQIYQIIEWFFDRSTGPSASLIDYVRGVAFNPAFPRYLKTVSRALLGKFGSAADLERIAREYDATNDPSERADIVCSISRMERMKRNALLRRFEGDGAMIRRACRWVRNQDAQPQL